MREFKFRAWDNLNKKMIYHVSVYESCAFKNNRHLPVLGGNRNYVIEQFTGLILKNIEVYEGDILGLYDNTGGLTKYIIKWCPDCYQIIGDNGNGDWLTLEEFQDSEFMGNIHKN